MAVLIVKNTFIIIEVSNIITHTGKSNSYNGNLNENIEINGLHRKVYGEYILDENNNCDPICENPA